MAQHDCPRCGGRYYSGQSVGAPDCPWCPRPPVTPLEAGLRIVVPYFGPDPEEAPAEPPQAPLTTRLQPVVKAGDLSDLAQIDALARAIQDTDWIACVLPAIGGDSWRAQATFDASEEIKSDWHPSQLAAWRELGAKVLAQLDRDNCGHFEDAQALRALLLMPPVSPAASPADFAKALHLLGKTPADLASKFKFINQVGPMPPANSNEALAEATGEHLRALAAERGLTSRPGETDAALRARMRPSEASLANASPAEPPGVVQLRADLGAVANSAAKVLGLLGRPSPAVHRLTFDVRGGWQALVDAGDCEAWPLRAHARGIDAHVRGVDARAATRAALERVAGWLATHSPAWRDRMPGEPLREALAGLQEALAAGYSRAGGSW